MQTQSRSWLVSEAPRTPGRRSIPTGLWGLGFLMIMVQAIMPGLGRAAWGADDGLDSQGARRLAKIERYLYGSPREGMVPDRLTRIEQDLLGRKTGHKQERRVASIFELLFQGTSRSPSLDMKVNVLEWKIFQKTQEGALPQRLAALDAAVTGQAASEPLAFRVEQLTHILLDRGVVSLHRVKIPAGTAIRLKLQRSLSSRSAKEGEDVPFAISEDLILDGNLLVLGKGGLVTGVLDKVKRGGRFGRTGHLRLSINEIEAIDSTGLPVRITGFGDGELDKKKIGMAIGASAVGYLAMGPVGLVGGAFIRGQDVEVDQGSVVIVTTTRDVSVSAIMLPRR
jgi:hypothetical protein